MCRYRDIRAILTQLTNNCTHACGRSKSFRNSQKYYAQPLIQYNFQKTEVPPDRLISSVFRKPQFCNPVIHYAQHFTVHISVMKCVYTWEMNSYKRFACFQIPYIYDFICNIR